MTMAANTNPLRSPALIGVMLLYAVCATVGITWGLPSRKIDKYLFGDGEAWPGEKIYALAGAEGKFSPTRGADVDADPLRSRNASPSPRPAPEGEGQRPIPLTATEADVARILLRYRLYTFQPDEMITMMALAGMKPGRLDFDPRLYQYGGLFVYPVGALIKLCGILGIIDVRGDVAYYLDHPDEFGKFYIVARAYSAAWGLLGVVLVYAIARRVAMRSRNVEPGASTAPSVPSSLRPSVPSPDEPERHARRQTAAHRAGVLAALFFVMLPVVVCMSHEGKPHLPGAVLMLAAVYLAMRCVEAAGVRCAGRNDVKTTGGQAASGTWYFVWMCLACGAAVGMVLSSWPIFALIPLTAFLRARGARTGPATDAPPVGSRWRQRSRTATGTLYGTALAVVVYLLTNPYIAINAFVNREVLRSNFGNSLAMYEVARIGEGFVRVAALTKEGATFPIVALGFAAMIVALVRRKSAALPLFVVAGVFFLQFVMIGAGKPAEYGRFGIFTNTALAIGAAALLTLPWRRRLLIVPSRMATVGVVLWTALAGGNYLASFHADAGEGGTRRILAESIRGMQGSPQCAAPIIGVPREPAPYSLPPMNFSRVKLYLASQADEVLGVPGPCRSFIEPRDRRGLRLSWVLQPSRALPFHLRADTPISWANKPLIMTVPGRPPDE